MANITYRTPTQIPPTETVVKNTPLTYEEMDGNFKSLDNDIQGVKSGLAGSGGAALVGYNPTGNVASTTVQGAINELDAEKVQSTTLAAGGGAALVGVTPVGTIAATNVQSAIAELDSDVQTKVGISNAETITGQKTFSQPIIATGGVTGTASGNVPRTSTTGSAALPAGTQAQRDASPQAGYIRFNVDLAKFEGYNGSIWSSVGGGATGGGSDAVFIENDKVVSSSYTIPPNKNAVSTGQIDINNGVTVTIPDGSRWVVL